MTAAIDYWDIQDSVKWDPHPGQLAIAENGARHKVVAAGRRFGKSDLGGHDLLPEAFLAYGQAADLKEQGKRAEFWIVGPEYSDAEKEFRVVYNNLSKLEVPFDRPGTYNDPIGGSLHISLWGGAFQIHGKSAKYPDTLVGEGLRGVILSEAAKLKERVWLKYIRPTLNDFKGWSLHTSTPEGRNWFYENWQRGQNPKFPDWASWRMPAWRNPYVYRKPTLDEDVKKLQEMFRLQRGKRSHRDLVRRYDLKIDDEIVDLMADQSEESFNQEIAADFTEFVGRVFKRFDEEEHVKDLEYNPAWQTFAAVDYGYTNPNVWLLIQVGPWGDIHVLDEVYEPGLTAAEFAHEIKNRGLCPGSVITFYPDPASPGDTAQLEQILKVRATAGNGGELKHRIDAIREALKFRNPHLPYGHPERKPQLLFNRRCKNTISDMQSYRYPDAGDKPATLSHEQPLKKDDHGPEALGRFFKGFILTPAQKAQRTRSSKAKFSRSR